MHRVLYVSKPVAPPWNDSSKNLVRDLALGLTRYQPIVMGRRGEDHTLGDGVLASAVYPPEAGGFAPGLVDNARVMGRLVLGHAPSVFHFFFAPNKKSSMAGRAAVKLRRVPSVHTVCSAPLDGVDVGEVLFADKTVVLSRHTEERMLEAGVAPDRLLRIPPAIQPIDPPSAADRAEARAHFRLPVSAPMLCYPGDLEFGGGARAVLEAFAVQREGAAILVMACRAKTPAAKDAELRLRGLAEELGVAERVVWVGETRRIHALLGCSDVVLLPTDTLYAKMDYPLVILEAMSLGCPVVVGAHTPAEELAEGDAALAVEVTRDAVAHAMDALLADTEGREAQGRRGRQSVLEHYTREPMAAAYEALYDGLCA